MLVRVKRWRQVVPLAGAMWGRAVVVSRCGRRVSDGPEPGTGRRRRGNSRISWLVVDCDGSALWKGVRLVLVIRADLVEAMVAHARADHPDEACGVIAGPEDSDRPERFIAMVNAERSPTFYRFDSGEQLKVWRAMDDADEAPVVIYHSHTATEAYPSRTDVSYASEPFAHYVLISTRDPEQHELRSYRIVDGEVTEEPVRIVDAYEN